MSAIEIIARYLCREDGRHPDGMYGDGPARHWEDYQRDADDIVAELAIAGYLIAKVTHTEPKLCSHPHTAQLGGGWFQCVDCGQTLGGISLTHR